jgi:hypothetical protein
MSLEQDPYIRTQSNAPILSEVSAEDSLAQQYPAYPASAEGIEAPQELSRIERLGDYASSLMDSMRRRTAVTLGAGALVLGGGAAAPAVASHQENPFRVGSDTQRTDAGYCAYIGYEDRLGVMQAAPSSQDPYKLGKIMVEFNKAWADCGDFIDVATRARFRVKAEGQTKWRVSDWGASTWGREADGEKVVNGLDYAGMTCDKDYGSNGSRDSIRFRPQLEHKITTLRETENGDLETIEKVAYETAPVRDAETIECRGRATYAPSAATGPDGTNRIRT